MCNYHTRFMWFVGVLNMGWTLCMPLKHSPGSATPITSLPFWPYQALLVHFLLHDLSILRRRLPRPQFPLLVERSQGTNECPVCQPQGSSEAAVSLFFPCSFPSACWLWASPRNLNGGKGP